MIRTHPEVLPTGVRVLSLSVSTLCRLCLMVVFSGDCERTDDLELEAEGDAMEEGPGFGACTDEGVDAV